MRRHAATALALAIALPACAQRGGGHAGFAARSAPAMRSAPSFRGSYAPSTSFHYSSGLAHAPMVYAPQGMSAAGSRYPGTAPINRPTFYHHGVIIRPYPYPYYGYGYGFYPSVVSLGGFYDNWDDYNPNLQTDNSAQPDNGYPAQPDYGYPAQPDYNYPQPPPEYGYAYPQPTPQPQYGYAYPSTPPYPAYPQSAPQPGYTVEPAPGYVALGQAPSNTPQMQYVPGSSETVTLIYKDGRPPEQIQNYLATRTTLTILDNGHRRVVPLSDLDIAATVRANRQTGVDFNLPTATP